jgi:DNA (cytosine-5)-methyltransferase 1
VALYPQRILSLCSGIGGLDLGLEIAVPGSRVVCHVEREAFASAILVARMEDKTLPKAPIWDDVRTFDGSAWRGKVDCITAGFPCQPVSTAGKRLGARDERWVWEDIRRIIREVRPPYLFLENVPGLISTDSGRQFGTVLGALAQLGYDAVWDVFSAKEIGATHIRRRVFILAKSQPARAGDRPGEVGGGAGTPDVRQGDGAAGPGGDHTASDNVGDPIIKGLERREPLGEGPDRFKAGLPGPQDDGELAHASIQREGRLPEDQGRAGDQDPYGCIQGLPYWPPSPRDRAGWAAILGIRPDLAPAIESSLCRVVNGIPAEVHPSRYRADRLRCLGNAVVPIVGAVAFLTLWRRLEDVA